MSIERTEFVENEELAREMEYAKLYEATYENILYVKVYTRGITDGHAWYWEAHIDMDVDEEESHLCSGGGSDFMDDPDGAITEALERLNSIACAIADRVTADMHTLDY